MVPKKDVYRVGGRHGVDESRAARSLAQPLPPIDGIKYLAPRAHTAKIQDLQGLVVVYVLAAAGMHGPFAFTRPPDPSAWARAQSSWSDRCSLLSCNRIVFIISAEIDASGPGSIYIDRSIPLLACSLTQPSSVVTALHGGQVRHNHQY
jgi:hypothetical protein